MAHRGDEVAMAAGLDTEHAEAGLGVVEGHPARRGRPAPHGRGLWSPSLAGQAGPGGAFQVLADLGQQPLRLLLQRQNIRPNLSARRRRSVIARAAAPNSRIDQNAWFLHAEGSDFSDPPCCSRQCCPPGAIRGIGPRRCDEPGVALPAFSGTRQITMRSISSTLIVSAVRS